MVDGMKFWGTAKVGSKGQIVIPADAREALGLKEGEKVIIISPPNRQGLMVAKAEVFEKTLARMQSNLTKLIDFNQEIKG